MTGTFIIPPAWPKLGDWALYCICIVDGDSAWGEAIWVCCSIELFAPPFLRTFLGGPLSKAGEFAANGLKGSVQGENAPGEALAPRGARPFVGPFCWYAGSI